MIYEIPLTSNGRSAFSITLGDEVVTFVTRYNFTISCWVVDIFASNSVPYLNGLVLVPGIDLLKPYKQLKRILGSLVLLELNAGDYISPDLLGTNVKLIWFPVGETFTPEYIFNPVVEGIEDKIYWGVSSSIDLNSLQIFQLNNEVAASRVKDVVYDCTGGKYPYYIYPVKFGDPSATINGFSFSGYSNSVKLIAFSNGLMLPYKFLRFNYLQHGSSIPVSWR